jgi:uncharacterized membrane protein
VPEAFDETGFFALLVLLLSLLPLPVILLSQNQTEKPGMKEQDEGTK